MPSKDWYEEKRYQHRYDFKVPVTLSFDDAVIFLKSRDYEIVEVVDIEEDDRYLERSITHKLCAVKSGEKADLRKNEITTVFYGEYQKVLLSLLINARDINYYEQLIKEQSK